MPYDNRDPKRDQNFDNHLHVQQISPENGSYKNAHKSSAIGLRDVQEREPFPRFPVTCQQHFGLGYRSSYMWGWGVRGNL